MVFREHSRASRRRAIRLCSSLAQLINTGGGNFTVLHIRELHDKVVRFSAPVWPSSARFIVIHLSSRVKIALCRSKSIRARQQAKWCSRYQARLLNSNESSSSNACAPVCAMPEQRENDSAGQKNRLTQFGLLHYERPEILGERFPERWVLQWGWCSVLLAPAVNRILYRRPKTTFLCI